MDNVNFATIAKHFADEDAARDLLEQVRWPNGTICPHCGVIDTAYKITPKPGSKTRKGLWKCKDCRKQFTVTVGTIFHGSRIPLHKWLMAIYLMCASKKGVSAHQLHRQLEITYKSAWFLAHRIREAMDESPLAEMLSGVVEADETYVGGKKRGGKRGRGSENKTPVAALVQRGGDIRAKKVERVTAATLKTNIRENVEPGAHIMTDELRSYRGLDKEFASHQTVAHSAREYVRGDVHVNTAESWFSLLKRGVYGTFHHVSDTHLDRYLNEFAFRWNHRDSTDGERTVSVIRNVAGKRLFYRSPIGRG